MAQVIDNPSTRIIYIIPEVKERQISVLREKKENVTPFLKWAGGKRQILPILEKHFPENFNDYFEPFLGGGSVYFYLNNTGRIRGYSYLSDFNSELINTFKNIQCNYIELLETLEKFKTKHSKEFFYEVRLWDRDPYFKKRKSVQKAARFMYLNKTCFNGIWRTNLKGENNVPYGNHKTPNIYEQSNVEGCSEYLNNKTELRSGDFKDILTNAKSGDFIFLDPPYDPYNKNTGFTNYNGGKFGEEMQEEVYNTFVKLDKRGCYVLLTNNATEYIKELYFKYEKMSFEVDVKRLVNSNGARRNSVKEIIIKNY